MSLKQGIKKVLVLGKGGEAKINLEVDCYEMQICQTLLDEGFEVLLLTTGRPTLIVTSVLSNSIYHLPLTIHSIKEIVEEEKPHAVFPLPAGSEGWSLARQLEENNYWKQQGIELLGTNYKTVEYFKDRKNFSEVIDKTGLKHCRRYTADSFGKADKIRKELGGFPVFLRYCSTHSRNETQIARNESELYHWVLKNLEMSSANKIWIEECLAGQKEIELGVIRDKEGGTAVVFAAENVDPIGIHSGDSIIIFPPQTLTDNQLKKVKRAAADLVKTFEKFTGYCTLKFAIDPETGRTLIFSIDFTLNQSSALASLAVGYPIAKVLTKVTIGYKIEEIKSLLKSSSLSEPSNHVLLKVPHFNTQVREQVLDVRMKSKGENIYAGRSFNEVLNKSWKKSSPSDSAVIENGIVNRQKLRKRLLKPYYDRLQNIYLAFQIGTSVEEIQDVTHIDPWFLQQIKVMAELDTQTKEQTIEAIAIEELSDLKKAGFSDNQIAKMLSSESRKVTVPEVRLKAQLKDFSRDLSAALMTVEKCSPYYFYPNGNSKKGSFKDNGKILVLTGTSRESHREEGDRTTSYFFIREAKRMGYEVIILSNSPYSTPYWLMLADKLYVEPVDWESVYNIYAKEEPKGVLVADDSAIESSLLDKLKEKHIKVYSLPSEVEKLAF